MTGITGYDENLLHLFFGTDVAPRGYVWIFPKRDGTANVGIGIGAYEKKTAKYYLDKWIAEQEGMKNGSIIEVNGGAIPVGGFLEKMQADNLIVAGDAGHMVDPIHGGGIGIAIEGGRLAAKHAIKAIKENNFSKENLEEYTKEWYKERGNELMRRLKGRHLLEQLSDEDFNYLADSITIDEALKIGNGTLTKTDKAILFTKKLITRPKLIKLMIKYSKD
jgi:digeranylgeranylglycerophospholipid reductase